ncbi:unnamed protein product, partial [Brachionus calyciflorus]
MNTKSSISISNLNTEPIYALIYWINEKKFSVESIYSVHVPAGERIREGFSYKVSYGSLEFDGIVKRISTKSECNGILNSFTNTEKKCNDTYQASKKDKNEITKMSTSEKKISRDLEKENLVLKSKIVELCNVIESEKNEKIILVNENLELKTEIEKHKETFTKDEIQKILK